MKTGKQVVNSKTIYFTDCLLMKSVMKMDIIALMNGVFTEFSENYYIKIGKTTNYSEKKQTKTNTLNSIKSDVGIYFRAGDIFKSLKRIRNCFD
jgi:predicted transcriptional regulator